MGVEKALHPLVQLAKDSVEAFIRSRKRIPLPPELTPEMKERAGVFVSLKKGGILRGCIGTIEAKKPTVAEEVIENAIASATHDPRFLPVTPDELVDLEYSVDILGAPEQVWDIRALDPKKYGVIVEGDGRLSLLLPDIEGIDTVEQQLDAARRKAGIRPETPLKVYRFKVRRYT